MSSGALPKQKSSGSSLGHMRTDIFVQNSESEVFKLEPKPKLFCIPNSCNHILGSLRKSQSLNNNPKTERTEKSCSVLFIGSKGHTHSEGMIM